MGTTKKYWKGLEELKNDPEFLQRHQNEFAEEIPLDKFLGNDALDKTSTNRRDFLKFLGFSVTAASLAACEAPVTKSIPYIFKPEEVTPGIANWYSSTYFDGRDYCSIIVKTREGRPIKVEGNELSPITKGATSARVQASVLSLYDSNRITAPYAQGSPSTWEIVDKEIKEKLEAIVAKGGNIRIVSSTIISPSTKKVIAEFTAKYPNTKHITYDAVSSYAITKANWISFDKAALPSYQFNKANVVVSIAADFLATWISPIEFANQYSVKRKVSKENPNMSKHIHFESLLSLTGSNADVRVPVKPSQLNTVVVNLYNAVAKIAGSTILNTTELPCDKQITSVARHLWNNKGKSLVVCGSNDIATQMVVNNINNLLENYGQTIDLDSPSYMRQGNDEEFTSLVSDMNEGKIDALFSYGVNPVYSAPATLKFSAAFNKVGLKISFADRIDESSELADYVCPDHHYLESWNDSNPKKGHYSLSQPTISPLFSQPRHEGTRAMQESLLKWADAGNTDYYSYIQENWKTNLFTKQQKEGNFTAFWNKSLHDGLVEVEEAGNYLSVSANEKISISEAGDLILKSAEGSKAGAWELVIYEKMGIGDGTHANNPWLQEMPDPVSKVTWTNYVTMSPADMEGKYKMLERQDYEASVVNVTINGLSIKLPVFPQPGQTPGTIGIAYGYGRTNAGKISNSASGILGANAFPFGQINNGTIQYFSVDAQVDKTSETFQIASTQLHHTIMGRDIVKETTLSEYKVDQAAGNPAVLIPTHIGPQAPEQVNLWQSFDRLNHHWGMTIDLNACIGCSACVVACVAENNIPVVGPDQIMKTRDLFWMRIDRYYESDMSKERAEKEDIGAIDMYLEMENPSVANPKVVFQPMMCQHCNHAPCETVCPVLATNHSSEGLNQMTYNRCVGTRYCANNCPYKVRRFNWFNYIDNPMFESYNPSQDDLGRMVLNPDVVVRSRGVMEKCSMCVQRIQEGKLSAKREERKVKDGEIKTACAQSCPTNAIVFGDLNDESAQVAQLSKTPRAYHVLAELNVQPNISYLTKVRNIDNEEV